MGREGGRALIPPHRDARESPRARWIAFAAKCFCFLQFLPLAMLAAGLFGALHDQVSYTVSSEYYTKFKFPMFGLLDEDVPERFRAAEVGFLASWWMGIPIGLLAGPAGFIQRTAPQMFRALNWCLAWMLGFTLAFAFGGLVVGYFETMHLDRADFRGWYIPDGLEHPRRFLCAGSMHNAAYLGGAISILVAWVFNILFRRRLSRSSPDTIPDNAPMIRTSAFWILVLASLGCSGGPGLAGDVDQATVPLHVEGNRPFVDLAFRKPDGSTRTARFLVDSGGGAFILCEPLARELGLEWGETSKEEGTEFGRILSPPQVSVGTFALELDPQRVGVVIGKDNILPPAAPGHADGMFPGHLLARYHVVFDYPASKFTIAKPGVLEPAGKPLPMPVSRRSGFPRTELEVDGAKLGFLIDTGASFTMVSEALLESWGNAHPQWPRHAGAVGEAATLGGQTLETMTVSGVAWGPHRLGEIGVTSQREGTFERWMSSMMTAPIVGSLAGNVLEQFRVELDYPNETLYLSKR